MEHRTTHRDLAEQHLDTAAVALEDSQYTAAIAGALVSVAASLTALASVHAPVTLAGVAADDLEAVVNATREHVARTTRTATGPIITPTMRDDLKDRRHPQPGPRA